MASLCCGCALVCFAVLPACGLLTTVVGSHSRGQRHSAGSVPDSSALAYVAAVTAAVCFAQSIFLTMLLICILYSYGGVVCVSAIVHGTLVRLRPYTASDLQHYSMIASNFRCVVLNSVHIRGYLSCLSGRTFFTHRSHVQRLTVCRSCPAASRLDQNICRDVQTS